MRPALLLPLLLLAGTPAATATNCTCSYETIFLAGCTGGIKSVWPLAVGPTGVCVSAIPLPNVFSTPNAASYVVQSCAGGSLSFGVYPGPNCSGNASAETYTKETCTDKKQDGVTWASYQWSCSGAFGAVGPSPPALLTALLGLTLWWLTLAS
eukprot:EG_transcript_28517